MGFVADVIEGVGDAVGDVVDFVGDAISDVGSAVDDLVHDIIPGGWAGIGAGALLAMGIYNPGLLGLASEGALTGEALASAGLDAAAVAEGAAAIAPEVAAATEAAVASGLSPEIIAMANATADPIAALNAAAGWTTADTAYLATIGATPELIAAAEANNATLAAGGTPGVTDAAGTGSNTQVFDDGSTLTTNPDGTITSTPATDGLPPVEDLSGTGVPGTNNPYGNGDIPLWAGVKDLGGALIDTMGPLGLLGAGALASGLLNKPIGQGRTGYEPLEYTPPDTGQIIPPMTNVGVSPGFINPQPMYQPTSDVGSQFYWGKHPFMATGEDLAAYNQVPGAPATPWGIQKGPEPLDINQFIRNTVNPQWQAASAGSSPGLYAPQAGPSAMPVRDVMPQAVTGPIDPALIAAELATGAQA